MVNFFGEDIRDCFLRSISFKVVLKFSSIFIVRDEK